MSDKPFANQAECPECGNMCWKLREPIFACDTIRWVLTRERLIHRLAENGMIIHFHVEHPRFGDKDTLPKRVEQAIEDLKEIHGE